jgi:hypothetical protein
MRLNFFFSVLLSGVAIAQSTGTFAATGNMSSPRVFHSATLLPNGKVLITGGLSSLISAALTLATAELYDPASGTFGRPGRMNSARSQHSATLLPNGKVLIAGGALNNEALISAELYDPATSVFTPTGNMTRPRAGNFAMLLPTGAVLITGADGTGSESSELYNPQTGTFTSTGSCSVGYNSGSSGSATLLADGRVLLVGYYTNLAALYDPATGQCAPAGIARRSRPSATLLPDGKVLFAGGNDDPGEDAGADLFDPSTGIFSSTGSMSTSRADHTATLLPDGRVLIAGSQGDGGYTLASAELYDPAEGAFIPTGEMNTSRGLASATLLLNGQALITGGIQYLNSPLASAEVYRPDVPIAASTLFTLPGGAQGQGAVWNGVTGKVISPDHPAAAGDVLSMYTNNLIEGGVIPPQIAVGGQLAEILFWGAAPGYPGYYQVNFRVPDGLAPGSAALVRLIYIGRPSNAVTIGVQ